MPASRDQSIASSQSVIQSGARKIISVILSGARKIRSVIQSGARKIRSVILSGAKRSRRTCFCFFLGHQTELPCPIHSPFFWRMGGIPRNTTECPTFAAYLFLRPGAPSLPQFHRGKGGIPQISILSAMHFCFSSPAASPSAPTTTVPATKPRQPTRKPAHPRCISAARPRRRRMAARQSLRRHVARQVVGDLSGPAAQPTRRAHRHR